MAPNDPAITAAWSCELERLVGSIRAIVNDAAEDSSAALPYELLYHWRNELDRLLGGVERNDPHLWNLMRTPATWLDSLLRLRSVLTHVVSKAYWSAHTEIRYSDIEIERYLWGAR